MPYAKHERSNLRTQLCKIIKRAGLKPWPKLFQNLRSTRQTELAEEYPAHVVCDWIGNSQAVAAKHYLQTTDEHFAKAAHLAAPVGGSEAAQNASHNTTLQAGINQNASEQDCENPAETHNTRVPIACGVGDTGFETPSSYRGIISLTK
jgi:hypothetical protein